MLGFWQAGYWFASLRSIPWDLHDEDLVAMLKESKLQIQ